MTEKVLKSYVRGKVVIDEKTYAELKNGEDRILIPEEEINSNRKYDPIEALLGVNIHYVITSHENDYLLGSRKKAMEQIADVSTLEIGSTVNCSVMKVKESFLIAEVAGRELIIPASYVSNNWIDLTKHVDVNSDLQGKIESLDPLIVNLKELKIGHVDVDLGLYKKGNQYVGSVIANASHGIIVQIDEGVTVMCRKVDWRSKPRVSEKLIVEISEVRESESHLYGFVKRKL